jgi:hypothetical protein
MPCVYYNVYRSHINPIYTITLSLYDPVP